MNNLKILFVLYLLLVFSLLRNFSYLKSFERVILAAEVNREEKNNDLDNKEFFSERIFKEIGKIIDFIKDIVSIIPKINDVLKLLGLQVC